MEKYADIDKTIKCVPHSEDYCCAIPYEYEVSKMDGHEKGDYEGRDIEDAEGYIITLKDVTIENECSCE